MAVCSIAGMRRGSRPMMRKALPSTRTRPMSGSGMTCPVDRWGIGEFVGCGPDAEVWVVGDERSRGRSLSLLTDYGKVGMRRTSDRMVRFVIIIAEQVLLLAEGTLGYLRSLRLLHVALRIANCFGYS